MAGPKKKKVDDAPQSKTARASMKGKVKDEGFKASADMKRIISCGGGTYAYLLDPRDGKTHHANVSSEKWATLIGGLLATPHGPSIQAELTGLGWSTPVNAEVGS